MKKLISITLTLIIITGTLLGAFSTSASAATTTIPTAYQNDYTALDYSTVAKNQGSYGLCWAFAAVACAEADAIKNHGADKSSIDLSEWHLAYFSYHGEREGTGDSVELLGTSKYYELGGYDLMAALTLSNRIGFANESVADYDVFLASPSRQLNASFMDECEYVIKNVYTYDITTEPDEIKKAIMEYGAVSVSYYGDESYTNSLSGTYAHYCSNTALNADHAVTIVGWNDDYSRTNFTYGRRPSSNGAWLVKNSWGSSWGLNGYFWISYEDATLTGGAVYDVVPADDYQRVYAHDGGNSLQYIEGSAGAQSANLFVADSDELLMAVNVGVFTEEDAHYTLNVYKNPSSTLITKGFEFDNEVCTRIGYLKNGLNTIDLKEGGIEMRKGDVFVIVVTTSADMMVDSAYQTKLGSTAILNSVSTVGKNQSFYRTSEYSEWYDVYDESDSPWNFRIKAYTKANDKVEPKILRTPSLPSVGYGDIPDISNISGGVVTDPASGSIVTGKWSYIQTVIQDGETKVELMFTPTDNVYYSCAYTWVSVDVTAVAPKIVLELPKSQTSFNVGDTVRLNFYLENPYDPTVKVEGDRRVYYLIEGETTGVDIIENSFVIPEEASGKTITVYFEYYGEMGQHEGARTSITLTVNKTPITDEFNDFSDDYLDGIGQGVGWIFVFLAWISMAAGGFLGVAAIATLAVVIPVAIAIAVPITVMVIRKKRRNRINKNE